MFVIKLNEMCFFFQPLIQTRRTLIRELLCTVQSSKGQGDNLTFLKAKKASMFEYIKNRIQERISLILKFFYPGLTIVLGFSWTQGLMSTTKTGFFPFVYFSMSH